MCLLHMHARAHSKLHIWGNAAYYCTFAGELNTGRDAARARRKVMIRECESLIEITEAQVKQIDRLKE